MSKSVLSVIKENSQGFNCLPCERINLDLEKFTEYRDSDEHPAQTPFEVPRLTTNKKVVDEVNRDINSIFRFFLDGSRRTYKAADIIIDGRYRPLVAGQVGVAVIQRDDAGYFTPVRQYCVFRNLIAFPSDIGQSDLSYLENKINQSLPIKFHLVSYTIKKERELVDLAVAKIMSEMQNLEILAVQQMADQQLLNGDNILVIDGPLRFKKKFDITQFRNVIGLSKNFRPSFTVGQGSKKVDVGALTSKLSYGERTSVFKTQDENKTIGMWYLRIRPVDKISNPLQGIVKIECYAVTQEEIENGLSVERVDGISAHLLRERNVTPYQADWRWASHIYPIYLAEKYVKSSFISDIGFQAVL